MPKKGQEEGGESGFGEEGNSSPYQSPWDRSAHSQGRQKYSRLKFSSTHFSDSTGGLFVGASDDQHFGAFRHGIAFADNSKIWQFEDEDQPGASS
jgi:hypothetical protein